MFGLTKREQRWAVQERDIKLILDAKRIADLEAQNKAMREALQAYSENKKIGLAATCVLAALDKEGE